MKIFIVGLPTSGRTTVARSLSEANGYQYIDATSWIRSNFRKRKQNEHIQQYEDEYQHYLSKRMNINPNFISDYVFEMMKIEDHLVYVIDGIFSPKDFAVLFDYRKDIVVFLNRIDNDAEFKDQESIGVSVMRDYCFWMSSATLLPKSRWIEYNFKMFGEKSDQVKIMGAQNSVFIVKSFDKVLSHLSEKVKELVNGISG